jgi:hypothetical protein
MGLPAADGSSDQVLKTNGSGTLSWTDVSATTMGTLSGGTPLVFEGATADAHETSLAVTDPTADHKYYLSDLGASADEGWVAAFAVSPGTNSLITSTPAELNILDGATVVVGEI